MKTKKKTSRTMGRVHNRARDDCFHPAINARTLNIAIKICQHHQHCRSAFTPFHAAFCQPAAFMPSALMPAFSALPQRFTRSPADAPRGVFTCTHMCPTGCRYCRWFGGFLRHGIMCALHSIGRLGGVGVACRRGGLSNTALSTTRRRRFPVIKSHAGMARGLLVRRLRLMSFRLLGILQAFAR